MSWLKVLRETPKWVVVTTVVVLIAMIYLGIINNYLKFAAEVEAGLYDDQYSTIWDIKSPAMPTMNQTNVIHVVGVVICIILGFMCMLLGITRSINKLDGTTSYLMAAFLVLFTLNTLSRIDSITIYFFAIEPRVLFINRWVTYFIYPFPFFLYIFYNLRSSFYKWTWPLFFLPVANSIAIWLTHIILRLPFEIVGGWHTAFTVICIIILMAVGFFGAVQKKSIWYTRVISLIWLIWLGSVIIRTLLGYQYIQHNEVIINIIISALVTVCYLVFTGSRELFTYKSHMQMLETKNGLLLDSYLNIESYISQIAFIKHEMRNHLLAINILLNEGDHERLILYLASIQDAYIMPAEPVFCGHKLIQSMLGHARQRAYQIGIDLSIEVTMLPQISITDADIVSLLMNLLNNALESCERISSPDKRWITVDINCRGPYLYVSVKNALYHEILHSKSNNLVTTKKDSTFHGYGVSVVKNVAKKYDGFTSFEYKGNSFIAEAALRVVVL